jgi:hypothetical protein
LGVYATPEPKQFAVTASSPVAGPLAPRSAQSAAEIYTEDIFRRGHVDVGKHIHPDNGVTHHFGFKTHLVVESGGQLLLKRRTFDCGFGTQCRLV